MTNELCMFEGGQGCGEQEVFYYESTDGPKFVSLYVLLTVHAKLCTSCLLYHFYFQQKMQLLIISTLEGGQLRAYLTHGFRKTSMRSCLI